MKKLPRKIKNYFHLLEALAANIRYAFPSRKLKVIGVTGTDGKTTTTHLIYHILKTAGKKASMISSVFADVGGKIYETGLHTTTPHAFDVQKFLSLSQANGDEYFVLETTSHALDQYRVWGTAFYCAVLTNITHEHLDYHHTYKEYVDIKARLLRQAHIGIVNSDDASFAKVVARIRNKQIISYGLKTKTDQSWDDAIKTNLVGAYNKENILVAYACARSLGIKKEHIYKAIKNFILPKGRFEIVYKGDYTVIIDFAHTPHAIAQLLSAIKKEYMKNQRGRLIHIFGSAGLRDRIKRPLMGGASGKYADVVVLTEEDYRTEKVEEICSQIEQGLQKTGFKKMLGKDTPRVVSAKTYVVVLDRGDGIKYGISLAQKDDVVVITGKGHEQSLCRGTIEFPWSDHKAVAEALRERKS